MSDNYERYHCQMVLPQFGKTSQDILQKARVLIVGIGGLGCPVAQYLAATGIGTIGIADNDKVSLNNLHRQVLYTPKDVGLFKVEIAFQKLQQLNPAIDILPYNLRITSFNVMELIADFDLVIDGSDNFETKYLLNDACVLSGKPLIYGAIYQYEGQVSIWNVLQNDGSYSPNYRDVFPHAENTQVPNCSDGGIIPTLAGLIGCAQANEAIKYFTNKKDLLIGKLWMFNALTMETSIVNLKKRTSVGITKLQETIATITLEQLKTEVGEKDIDLIDVRTQEEHSISNIGGRNIPLNDLDINLDKLNLSKSIVCYCASGSRSTTAVRLIKNHHPEAIVYSLKLEK